MKAIYNRLTGEWLFCSDKAMHTYDSGNAIEIDVSWPNYHTVKIVADAINNIIVFDMSEFTLPPTLMIGDKAILQSKTSVLAVKTEFWTVLNYEPLGYQLSAIVTGFHYQSHSKEWLYIVVDESADKRKRWQSTYAVKAKDLDK